MPETRTARPLAGEQHAVPLLRAARPSHEPLTTTDRCAFVDPDGRALSVRRAPLCGVPIRDALSARQRIQMRVYRLAGTVGVGIWLDLILKEGPTRALLDIDLSTRRAPLCVGGGGQECWHSVMIARYITVI
ncbi:diiron oxygenase [Kitasatospora indigofera]|uniref:diiron oxygenase n=1 Tax=Kitasatospora indigofera TaxID=67307 RepID=UPI0036AC005D